MESDVFTLRDLEISNGTLKMDYINGRITNKSDIFREVHLLRIALKQYNIPENANPAALNLPIYVANDIPTYQLDTKKSKFFYQNMMIKNTEKPTSLKY